MKQKPDRRWVRRVQQTSDAMDLPPDIFKKSPRQIALGLRRSVLESKRTKGTKFQSAMSMLNYFINRGGRGLSSSRRRSLELAKEELRAVFGRAPQRKRARKSVTTSRSGGSRRPRVSRSISGGTPP